MWTTAALPTVWKRVHKAPGLSPPPSTSASGKTVALGGVLPDFAGLSTSPPFSTDRGKPYPQGVHTPGAVHSGWILRGREGLDNHVAATGRWDGLDIPAEATVVHTDLHSVDSGSPQRPSAIAARTSRSAEAYTFPFLFPANPMKRWIRLAALAVALAGTVSAQPPPEVTIARVKYGGGGDWYSGEESLPNLLRFVREHTLLDVAPREEVAELTSDKLFQYPYLYLNGH